MNAWYALAAIAGLAVITVVTRSFFLIPERELPLPDWMAGVRLGGLVTWDGFLLALFDGMRLAAMLVCIGAANALVNPSRLLRIVPAALYEAGVAVVVCMSVAVCMVWVLPLADRFSLPLRRGKPFERRRRSDADSGRNKPAGRVR